MAIFYKKILSCGCIVIALTVMKKDDIFILGGHNYYHLCNECKLNVPEEILDDKLDSIYRNDNEISKDNDRNCIKINSFSDIKR